MIHQLGWREDTDLARLYAYALRLAPEKEFFIRKAIGWAFRDLARWDPDGVRSFLNRHRAQFSGLTLREALKHL
jgi:3-methyladenine DNA glycosylase AlkD